MRLTGQINNNNNNNNNIIMIKQIIGLEDRKWLTIKGRQITCFWAVCRPCSMLSSLASLGPWQSPFLTVCVPLFY